MWSVWLERNRRSFEDNEKTLDELKGLCQQNLSELSRCWVLLIVLLSLSLCLPLA